LKAPFLVRDALAVREYVNADPVARWLSAFDPESVADAAGSFGFETTLASWSFAPWLRRRSVEDGYRVHLVFCGCPTPRSNTRRALKR
jgi:predicted ABC-type ATPase